MSPRRATAPPTPAATALANRLATSIGSAVREERRRRAMTTRELARRARLSPASVDAVEAGRRVSLDVYARTTTALGLSLDLVIGDRRRTHGRRDVDLVHAAMGEFEARRLSPHDYRVAIDHPYQHYQFAGRADVLAWSASARALLHIENRTLFPDIQEAAGSFNAKCQYLAPVLARQMEILRSGRSATRSSPCGRLRCSTPSGSEARPSGHCALTLPTRCLRGSMVSRRLPGRCER